MLDIIPAMPKKGRGAISNRAGRHEKMRTYLVNDGWNIDAADLKSCETSVTDERPKTIITYNQSPDLPFDRSINPYRGCEHGCVYCYARPTHAYHGLSPGLDFESKLFAKPNAAELLEAELRKPGYIVKPVAIGTNTDPYQPIEKKRRIMRRILEVLEAYNHPVSIITKSALVLRDIDILGPMSEQGLAAVAFSITTLDQNLARTLEPRAATPKKRLGAMQRLSDSGIKTFCLAAPMIPGLNDHELERIIDEAVAAGASGADYILLRLPIETKGLFTEWLTINQPARKSKIINMIRVCRGGALYDSNWDNRQRGTGHFSELLKTRMNLINKRLGLNNKKQGFKFEFNSRLFKVPSHQGEQFELL